MSARNIFLKFPRLIPGTPKKENRAERLSSLEFNHDGLEKNTYAALHFIVFQCRGISMQAVFLRYLFHPEEYSLPANLLQTVLSFNFLQVYQ
jgi:hypothetical protein